MAKIGNKVKKFKKKIDQIEKLHDKESLLCEEVKDILAEIEEDHLEDDEVEESWEDEEEEFDEDEEK